MKKIKVVVGMSLLLFSVESVYALDPVPKESGFHGFVRLGGGVLNYSSNTIAGNNLMDVGQKTITSLSETPDSESTGMGLVNFELSWTFAESRTQILLGSELEDIARMELGQQLAVKKELKDKSIISAGLLFTGVPTEVWKDPFLTGEPRQETDRTSTGARFVYDRILGTDFELRYSYRSIDIDDELSGFSLPLTGMERESLQRDGDRHSIDLSYRFKYEGKHFLIPSVTYLANDRDGDAVSSDGFDFQLTYIYIDNPVTFVANAHLGFADYDANNPVFGKTQEDDRYGIGAQVYYKNPFGWKPLGNEDFSVFAAASYLKVDTNINFYETEAATGVAGVIFRF